MVATLTSGPSERPAGTDQFHAQCPQAAITVPISERSSMSARILSTAHTAQYQYIPALALPKQDELNLRLNNPPSFRNPKSVIVIGLPPVRPSPLPPLRGSMRRRYFAQASLLCCLPADGAPLVFATELAHNFVLHVEGKSGPCHRLPANPGSHARRIPGRNPSRAVRRSGRRSDRNSARRVGLPLLRGTTLPSAHFASPRNGLSLPRMPAL